MDTGINLSQEQLQKLSINQIQSLHILSLSAESLHDLLQKESEENPFMDYSPVTTNSVSSDGTASFLNFVAAPEERIYFRTSQSFQFHDSTVGTFLLFSGSCRYARLFDPH